MDEAERARLTDAYGDLPLQFEVNRGQTNGRVNFLARGAGLTLFLSPTEAVLVLSKPDPHRRAKRPPLAGPTARRRAMSAVRMSVLGANKTARVTGEEELPGKANYLIGNDPAQWRTNLPTYARVLYHDIYPGIDLIYHGQQRRLEYDFVVGPWIDPGRIALGFGGADRLEVDGKGDLVLHSPAGPIRQSRPLMYQEVDGARRTVAGGYVVRPGHQVAFDVGAYDRSKPLVIDPVLLYSTYLGGSGDDVGLGIAVEGGRAYVTGSTGSIDFPTTLGVVDGSFNGALTDAFVTKLNRAGTALVYSTYLGGSADDVGEGVAVRGGRAYVVGYTRSVDFPTTPGAVDTSHGGGYDAFVTKLNRSGTALVYSTYLGGSGLDLGLALAVDDAGRATVTGETASADLPTTSGAFDTTFNGGFDAFVTRLNRTGSTLIYSTYLGGGGSDVGWGVALDGSGGAYVVGETTSAEFPTTLGAFDEMFNGGYSDAFVTKLNERGSQLVYSTYIGGAGYDQAVRIAVDRAGCAYAVGGTSSRDFPTTAGAFDTTYNGGFSDGFVTKIDPVGSSLVYSTFLGGSGTNDEADGVAVDRAGRAYVTGVTGAPDFPTTDDAFDTTFNGGSDAFVTQLNRSGSALLYSTYLGGSAFDGGIGIALHDRSVYLTGFTASVDFPTTADAFDTTWNGGFDAFIAKFGPTARGDEDDNESDDDEQHGDEDNDEAAGGSVE